MDKPLRRWKERRVMMKAAPVGTRHWFNLMRWIKGKYYKRPDHPHWKHVEEITRGKGL